MNIDFENNFPSSKYKNELNTQKVQKIINFLKEQPESELIKITTNLSSEQKIIFSNLIMCAHEFLKIEKILCVPEIYDWFNPSQEMKDCVLKNNDFNFDNDKKILPFLLFDSLNNNNITRVFLERHQKMYDFFNNKDILNFYKKEKINVFEISLHFSRLVLNKEIFDNLKETIINDNFLKNSQLFPLFKEDKKNRLNFLLLNDFFKENIKKYADILGIENIIGDESQQLKTINFIKDTKYFNVLLLQQRYSLIKKINTCFEVSECFKDFEKKMDLLLLKDWSNSKIEQNLEYCLKNIKTNQELKDLIKTNIFNCFFSKLSVTKNIILLKQTKIEKIELLNDIKNVTHGKNIKRL